MSVRTLYAYLDDGLFTARNIVLKRKVKFKLRKCHNTQFKDRAVFLGRVYADFQALSPDHWTEMDTVHSSNESKKVLLTFFLKREKLFLAFLMNRCAKGAVHAIFDRLGKKLGTYLFDILLTDRGSEFGDPVSLDAGINGIERTNIYYCDPMRSGQKGGRNTAGRSVTIGSTDNTRAEADDNSTDQTSEWL